MFLQARVEAYGQMIDVIRELIPELDDAQIHQLATYAIAGADGMFIAKEIGGDSVDLIGLFELHARAMYETALRMIAEDTDH